MEINGEYWIIDGRAIGADNDDNHEYLATQHIISVYEDKISALLGHVENDFYLINTAIKNIDKKKLVQLLGEELLDILLGRGDSRFYVMKYFGWIALRGENAELYKWNSSKKEDLATGIGDIVDEGSEVEISIYDHFSGKNFYLSLAQLEQPGISPVINLPAMTRGKLPLSLLGNFGKKGISRQINLLAQRQGVVGPGQQLWRGTSEGFKEWLLRENLTINQDGSYQYETSDFRMHGFIRSGELYVTGAVKNINATQNGLLGIALDQIIKTVRSKNILINKITAEASPSFLGSLQKTYGNRVKIIGILEKDKFGNPSQYDVEVNV